MSEPKAPPPPRIVVVVRRENSGALNVQLTLGEWRDAPELLAEALEHARMRSGFEGPWPAS